jgi:hypothetical protein
MGKHDDAPPHPNPSRDFMLGSRVPQADVVIERARAVPSLPYREIARSISADESTLHRWRSDTCVPSMASRVRPGALDNLISLLDQLFRAHARTRARLDEPLPWTSVGTPPAGPGGRPDLLTGTLLGRGHVRLTRSAL